LYLRVALTHTAEEHAAPPPLHFGRRGVPRLWPVLLQLLLALGLLTGAAEVFVTEVQAVAALAHIGLLTLSLLLVPLATELPEKFNSVSWLARRKDGLAIGNLTGAMVFQSAIPGAIGLAFTDWQLTSYSWLSSGIAVFSMVVLWLVLRIQRPVSAWLLMGGGLLYGLFVADVLH
ncbi:MAG: sodium:calcium antiporter, partial [Chloroflexota bacterium]